MWKSLCWVVCCEWSKALGQGKKIKRTTACDRKERKRRIRVKGQTERMHSKVLRMNPEKLSRNILEELRLDLGNKHHKKYAQESRSPLKAESLPVFPGVNGPSSTPRPTAVGSPSEDAAPASRHCLASGRHAHPCQTLVWASIQLPCVHTHPKARL